MDVLKIEINIPVTGTKDFEKFREAAQIGLLYKLYQNPELHKQVAGKIEVIVR